MSALNATLARMAGEDFARAVNKLGGAEADIIRLVVTAVRPHLTDEARTFLRALLEDEE